MSDSERVMLRSIPGADAPTLADFIRHAERFGGELVFETAESFLGESELVQLSPAIYEADTARRRRFQTVKRPKRLSGDQKLRAIQYLVGEGVPTSRIAIHLGISVRQVERLRRHLRERGAVRGAEGARAA